MRRLLAIIFGLVLFAGACDSDGGGGGAASAARYCDAIEKFQGLQDELESPDVDPDASPEEAFEAMRGSFRELRDRVEELRGVAPAPIRDDVNKLVDAAIELIDLFLDIEDPTDLASNSDALSRMSELQEEVTEAQENVAEYTKEECGIDLDADETGGGETEATLPEDFGDEIPEEFQDELDQLEEELRESGGSGE